MKVLVYGFKPYNNYKENVSEKILYKVKPRKNLKKVIFDVGFNKEQFVNKIKDVNPEIVIGLGQYPRGKKLRIERKSVNLKRNSKKEKPVLISKNKPKYSFANLKLKKDKDSWLSYDAGEYVCNYSMFVISSFCKNIKFAFVHIPKDYDIGKGAAFVGKLIDSFNLS